MRNQMSRIRQRLLNKNCCTLCFVLTGVGLLAGGIASNWNNETREEANYGDTLVILGILVLCFTGGARLALAAHDDRGYAGSNVRFNAVNNATDYQTFPEEGSEGDISCLNP